MVFDYNKETNINITTNGDDILSNLYLVEFNRYKEYR